MDNISIKEFLEQNYDVICDTNVLLRLYDYSPEFTDFGIKCLDSIKDNLLITYTTYLEYNKHYMSKYAAAKNKVKNSNKKLKEITEKYKEDIDKEFLRISQYHFPDMDDLKYSCVEKINELKNILDEYYDDHELLVAINDQYLEVDPIHGFVSSIRQNVLTELPLQKIYEICDDGENRFKKQIPPGYKDAKKGGIRQYSDLILWNEIIKYSLDKKKNIIFVTDDVKEDWWEIGTDDEGNAKKVFHPRLVEEFKKISGNEIIALISNELYSIISAEYNIEISDTVNMALSQTIDEYISEIKELVFYKIQDDLEYYPEKYIDESTANIGTEGLENCEIEDYLLVNYSLVERNDTKMIYELSYQVSMSAESCNYVGRDDDTKEVLKSPPNKHKFEGEIKVQVVRTLDDFVDLLYYNTFEEWSVISSELEQTEFVDGYELEYYEPYEEGSNYCPKCGKPISYESDALNGFCYECTEKYDI